MENNNNLYAIRFYRNTDPKNNGKISGTPNIIWGAYDDISIKCINNSEIQEIIKISDNGLTVDSDVGSIDCPSNILVLYSPDEAKNNLNLNEFLNSASNKQGHFFTITMITIKEEVMLSEGYSKIIENINNIAKNIEEANEDKTANFEIGCFGTLGVYDLCLITVTDRISDAIDFVYVIQNSKFTSSYSIVTYNGEMPSGETFSSNEKGNCIANIQITYESGADIKEIDRIIREKLILNPKDKESVKSYNVLGEFDLCIHIPLRLMKINAYNDLCNSTPKEIKQIITRFSKDIEDIKYLEENDTHDKHEECGKTSAENKAAKDIDTRINERIQELLKHDSNKIAFAIHILYIDYKRIISLNNKESDTIQIQDIRYQFISIIDRIYEMVRYGDSLSETKMNEINKSIDNLANLFSRSLYNVIQSQGYGLAETYSYFRNAGIFYKIFMAYNSFIKSCLVLFYLNCNPKQSEIVPILSFDSVDVPKSIQYSDINISYEEAKDKKIKPDNTRVISINLPFDAITKMEVYLPLLIHEISHYLCPLDRENRNKQLLKIILEQFFSSIILNIKGYICNKTASIASSQIQIWICEWFNEDEEKNFKSFIQLPEVKNFFDFDSVSQDFITRVNTILTMFYSNELNEKTENDSEVVVNAIQNIFAGIINKCLNSFINDDNDKINTDWETLNPIIKLHGYAHKAVPEIGKIIIGIKEIFCDMMMIEVLQLSMHTYCALTIISMMNQNLTEIKATDVIVRLGYILCYRQVKKDGNLPKELKLKAEDQEKVYNIVCLLMHQEIEKEKVYNLIDEFNNAFNIFQTKYIVYYNDLASLFNYYGVDRFDFWLKQAEFTKEFNPKVAETFANFIDVNGMLHDIYNSYNKSTSKVNNTSPINLEIISHLKNTIPLYQLNEFLKKCNADLNDKNVLHSPSPIKIPLKTSLVTDLLIANRSFDETIEVARSIITDNVNEQVWYRGQQNASWQLLPALIRRAKNDEFARDFLDSYEQFRAQACCAGEIYSHIDSEADWIACMQHYLVPTHFLDWSEQPFPSLYFALENYFYPPCEFQKDKFVPDCDVDGKSDKLESDAALYVLNPQRMNMALKCIREVPNISLPNNRHRYAEYILPYPDPDNQKRKNKTFESKDYYPIAVITSQLTGRILAQKGHFTAFNVRVPYEDIKNNKVEGLYEIQQRLLDNGDIKKPFMVKIHIPHNRKERLANLLRTYGIKKSTYYPELMNIGTDLEKSIYSQR